MAQLMTFCQPISKVGKDMGPLFSIIIPVHNVEGYLRNCINSVLLQSYDNIEIIVINDASTDSSGRILQEFANKKLITLINLEDNVGLAESRNIGIKQASGKYILFLDSDDELESGLLSHVAKYSDADLVVFNHHREWATGKRINNQKTALLETLSKAPLLDNDVIKKVNLFDNLNVAWNKVYRKTFLLENNLNFLSGYYEDISFNYKCIIFAKKIYVTSFFGYKYTQREGSILNSRSDKHTDIINQYTDIFNFIDTSERLIYKEKISTIFINHIFNLLTLQRNRLTITAENNIIDTTKKIIEKFNVKYNKKNRAIKLKIRYLENTNLFFNSIFSKVIKLIRKCRTVNNNLFTQKFKILPNYILYRFVFLHLSLDDKLIVFESYWGRSYSCNPRVISEYLAEKSDFKLIWFGNDKNMDVGKAKYIQKYSLKYFYYLARAKYLVSNANFPNLIKKRKGSIHLQTKHGTPLKLMGCDELKYTRQQQLIPALINRTSRWDYVLSSNAYSTETWRRSFPGNYEILEYGYPRNDKLVIKNRRTDYKKLLKENILTATQKDKIIILYMPTFRDDDINSNYLLDKNILSKNISDDVVFLYRSHYFNESLDKDLDNIIDVSAYPQLDDLYLIADVLITDFSSAMFDFILLDRPIILYLPDYEKYHATRGLYFDIREKPPGPICYNENELFEFIKCQSFLSDGSSNKRKEMVQYLSLFDDGRATEKVCAKVFNIQYLDE